MAIHGQPPAHKSKKKKLGDEKKVNAKITRRVFTFSVMEGEESVEKTIERVFIVGGPDPSVMTDDYITAEAKREFGAGVQLVHTQDFSKEVQVDFPE